MKYSVIFTTYNRSKLTGYAIKSAIVNAGMGFELIWVDDASTENEVKETMKSLVPDISILREKNGGWAKSVNEGMRVATGDYIFILDNDWFLPENWLVIFNDYIKNIPNTGGICMMWKGFDNYKYKWAGEEIEINGIKVRKANKIMGFRCFSRNVFNKVGYLDERMGWYGPQDSDWSNRALRTGELFYFIPGYEVLHVEDGFNNTKKEKFMKKNLETLKNKKDKNIYYSPYEKNN